MIIKNKRALGRLLCLCVGILLPWGISAQEADPFEAEKARIREIKLSGDYYYRDVSSEDAEDARLMALRLLAMEIQEEETGCEGVESLLQDSCRCIQLKRIDRPRVFVYIAKETVAVWLDGGTPPPAEPTVAQTPPPVAKAAPTPEEQVREIKLSERYYYTDVSLEDAEEARAMALRLLVLDIQGQQTGCEKVAGLLQDSCRYIRLERIDRPRVFAYIAKETVAVWLNGGPLPPAEVPIEETVLTPTVTDLSYNRDTVARPDTSAVRIPADTLAARTPADTSALRPMADNLPEDEEPIIPVTTVEELVTETGTEATADTVAAVETLTTTIRDTVTTVVTDTVKVVVRDTVSLTVTDTVRTRLELRTTGNDRLDRILRMKTITEVQPFFITEKKEGRMMFGKMSSALRPEECYLLFFNREGKVVAVLGKGSHTRLNLLTGQNDSADRYREGNGVIWFLLYE